MKIFLKQNNCSKRLIVTEKLGIGSLYGLQTVESI